MHLLDKQARKQIAEEKERVLTTVLESLPRQSKVRSIYLTLASKGGVLEIYFRFEQVLNTFEERRMLVIAPTLLMLQQVARDIANLYEMDNKEEAFHQSIGDRSITYHVWNNKYQ